ncbi:phage tail assembly protein T [Psychrobacter pocilloporae]|uniref:phage tail assembly protein T n=1 Tax=Psychrobacter pocilloporae TaxID=1775882 RepID=UPI003C2FA0B8
MAGHLGKTITELDALVGMDELRAWQAFDSIDPIGGYRGDLQAATIAQHIAMWSGHCKETPPLAELLPIDPHPMTPEQKDAVDAAKARARSDAYTANLIATLQSKVKK